MMEAREKRIYQMIEPTVNDMGYELVNVKLAGPKGAHILDVMADARETSDIEGYAKLSHAISAILDVEDPIVDRYTLNVGSPGIDRPLIKIEDFERFKSYYATIELDRSVVGRRNYKGKLIGVDDNEIAIEVDNETHYVPFDKIAKAKLVLTDRLIKDSKNNKI